MEILIWFGIFVLSVLMLQELYYIARAIWKPELKRIQKRYRTLSTSQYGNEAIDILKKKTMSEVPWLNRMLLRSKRVRKMELVLEQADTSYPIGFYILLSLLLFAGGCFGVSFFTRNYLLIISAGLSLFFSPSIYILRKKDKRMRKFQSQLPEALELVARSLKAGHAFTGGIKMVADEFDDPIGPEFEKTINEINFGVGIPEALKNLSNRVDCEDLRFFTVSVIIQRETGGNLAEILENLGLLIRDRFKLQGRIRTLSAEGKLSAVILIAIPFFVVLALSIMNPEYISVLVSDPIGKLLIFLSLTGMGIGVLVIRKLIRIKV